VFSAIAGTGGDDGFVRLPRHRFHTSLLTNDGVARQAKRRLRKMPSGFPQNDFLVMPVTHRSRFIELSANAWCEGLA